MHYVKLYLSVDNVITLDQDETAEDPALVVLDCARIAGSLVK